MEEHRIEARAAGGARPCLSVFPLECVIPILRNLNLRDLLRYRFVSRELKVLVDRYLRSEYYELTLADTVATVRVHDARNPEKEAAADGALAWLSTKCPQLHTVNLWSTPVTNSGIERLVQQCSNLHVLDLAHCPHVSDAGVRLIAASCPNLLGLDLVGCPDVSDFGVKAVIILCPNLQAFYIGGVRGTTDTSLIHLKACKSLHTLFTGGLRISDETIRAAAAGGQLHTLHCNACFWVTDISLFSLAQNCASLRILNANGCRRITDAGVAAIATNCRSLTLLDIGGCTEVTDASVQLLAACKQLDLLNLDDCEAVTGATLLKVCKACTRLTKLSIRNVKLVKTEELFEIVSILDLKALRVDGCAHLESALWASIGGSTPDIRAESVDIEIPQLRDLRLVASDSAHQYANNSVPL